MTDRIRDLSTRERLLDVAERLFADKGVDNVSIRSINAAAQLSPGILHYHFGNKDTLLEAIVARRMDEIMAHRYAMISNLSENTTPTTNDVAAILVTPLAHFVINNKQSGLSYVRLIARLHSDNSQILSAVTQRYQDQVVNPLLQLFNKSCGQLSAEQLSLRINFASHTLLQSAGDWSVDETVLTSQASQLMAFIGAGLDAK
ncbi:MAG: AcrR family transcriptional regulator [Flavobacteriales bacterium]|jgi:AcrR family transcriptional regulator|tara:strand:- start:3387 stop:3992 length:606 start_codon:yes stop_codon:yes gene_type:complete